VVVVMDGHGVEGYLDAQTDVWAEGNREVLIGMMIH
jgi:hypothetical protein